MLITDEFVAKYSAAVRRAAATTDDAKLAIMLTVATDELAVSTAAEAVALVVSSERVNVDMHAWLSHAKTHPMNWVVRSWQPVAVDMEFRCFVFGGKITAISQYNHNCFFKRLVAQKARLQALLLDFFAAHCQTSCNALYPDGYVLDLAVMGESLDEVLVIEINPGLSSTSGCLFDWVVDKAQIHEGGGGAAGLPEFRVREAPDPELRTKLRPDWSILLDIDVAG